MSDSLNKILLNPRFKINIYQPKKVVKEHIDNRLCQSDIDINFKNRDGHFFIDIGRQESRIWSPQLHLELLDKDERSCLLKGFFAPNPTIWTLFMFFHFVIAVGFLIFSALAYANYVSKGNYSIWIILMAMCMVLWFLLYLIGQIGKHKAKNQMEYLKNVVKKCVGNLETKST